MSKTTTNYNLIKPELTDAANITAMDGNWDAIDNALKENADAIKNLKITPESIGAARSSHKHDAGDINSGTLSSDRLPTIPIDKGGMCNPNLLDNWYFVDPINQRGKSSYSGAGYTIDRWTMVESSGTVTLGSAGLTVSGQLRQYLENPNDTFNKQITASVLLSDGTLHTGTATPTTNSGGQLIVDNTNVHLYFYVVGSGDISFIIECRSSVTIQAVKLEFGSKQTLATKNSAGKWVLSNTPPNKTLEELRCNSSTDDTADSYANHPIPKYSYGTTDLTAGSSPLETGKMYLVYE